MIAARRGGEFVQETLVDECNDIGPRRAPGSAGRLPRHQRLRDAVVVDKRPGIDGRADAAAGYRSTATVSEADEMITPSADLTVGIDCTRECMKSASSEEIEVHVVFAFPRELDGTVESLGDDYRFCDHVVDGSSAETAAGTHLMHRDLIFIEIDKVRDHGLGALRRLCRRPQLHNAVVPPRSGILRF